MIDPDTPPAAVTDATPDPLSGALADTRSDALTAPQTDGRAPDPAPPAPLDVLFDVPVLVEVILGRARMTVADLLRLAPGDVVDLDRKVGEPVDILLGDRLIARGELVIVDNRLGVTLSEMVRDAE